MIKLNNEIRLLFWVVVCDIKQVVGYRIKITAIIIFDGCIAAGIGAVFIIYF